MISCGKAPQPDIDNGSEPDIDSSVSVPVVTPRVIQNRALWASVNGRADAADKEFKEYNDKILVSWRLYETDAEDIAFDIYRQSADKEKVKLNSTPIKSSTCWVDDAADTNADNTYYLHMSDSGEELDSYTMKAAQSKEGIPYISIPLKTTGDLGAFGYNANDAGIGDIDGDGMPEIVI